MSQTYKSAGLEPIPVGNTVSNIVLSIEGKWRHFKIPANLFSFRKDKSKPKQLRLPFSGEFFSILIRHISPSTPKSIVVTGVNL